MHKLIINIDDFGMSPEINERILSVLELKLANSVSVFANETYKKSFKQLERYSKSIDIGVHLYHDFSKTPYTTKEVLESFKEQINRALSTGIDISHIDNHRPEVYFHPEIFQGVIDLAHQFRLFLRYPMVGFNQEMCLKLANKYKVDSEHVFNLHLTYFEKIQKIKIKHINGFFSLEQQDTNPDRLINHMNVKHLSEIEVLSHAGNSDENYSFELNYLKKLVQHSSLQLSKRNELNQQ